MTRTENLAQYLPQLEAHFGTVHVRAPQNTYPYLGSLYVIGIPICDFHEAVPVHVPILTCTSSFVYCQREHRRISKPTGNRCRGIVGAIRSLNFPRYRIKLHLLLAEGFVTYAFTAASTGSLKEHDLPGDSAQTIAHSPAGEAASFAQRRVCHVDKSQRRLVIVIAEQCT